MAIEVLETEFLLKKILNWYTNSDNWKPKPHTKFSPTRANRVIRQDPTRLARMAIRAQSIGKLIDVVCDAYKFSLTELSQISKIPQSRMYEIVRGSDPTKEESILLRKALDFL